jgi:serine/threonine protein kinase
LKFCRGCGTRLTASAPPPVSALVFPPLISLAGGRYHILRPLGEGSKKRVYLARDTLLEREVAVAVFKTTSLDDAGRAQIQREARALGQLGDHPHIVTIFDVGEESGQPYFVS